MALVVCRNVVFEIFRDRGRFLVFEGVGGWSLFAFGKNGGSV